MVNPFQEIYAWAVTVQERLSGLEQRCCFSSYPLHWGFPNWLLTGISHFICKLSNQHNLPHPFLCLAQLPWHNPFKFVIQMWFWAVSANSPWSPLVISSTTGEGWRDLLDQKSQQWLFPASFCMNWWIMMVQSRSVISSKTHKEHMFLRQCKSLFLDACVCGVCVCRNI